MKLSQWRVLKEVKGMEGPCKVRADKPKILLLQLAVLGHIPTLQEWAQDDAGDMVNTQIKLTLDPVSFKTDPIHHSFPPATIGSLTALTHTKITGGFCPQKKR